MFDEQKTKEVIKMLLSKYHTVRRLSGVYPPDITPTYMIIESSIPSLNSTLNEELTNRKLKARALLRDMHSAINKLSQQAKELIYLKYITDPNYYDYRIYESLFISKNTYYIRLNEAYIEFAKAFRNGGLIIYEDSQLDKEVIQKVLNQK